MSANTLYDVLKPIIFLVSIYGVKMKLEESVRWVTKGFQLLFCFNLPTCFALYVLAFEESTSNLSSYRFRIKIVACTLCFFYINWRIRSVNTLLATLNTFKKSAGNEKAFEKTRRVIFCVLGFVFLENLYEWIGTMTFVVPSFPNKLHLAALFLAIITGPILTFYIITFALSTLTFFVCLVVYYVSLSFDEPMEQLKRCESPLRRAKMTSDLIRHFDRMNKLTGVTDALGATLLFILKMTSILQFFSIVHYWDKEGKISPGDSVSLFPVFIYLWFLRTAPSVNSKLSQLFRTLRESVMEDDLWLSRDPTSRPHLLRLRLSQLEQLSHLSLGQSQFTILNEPVDETDVFTFFVEMFDTWNSINSAAQ